jgi:aminocarboxymuconate-semialdehyde decarboxylase
MTKGKIIDVHTHVYLPRYMEMLRSRSDVPRVFTENGCERLLILPNENKNNSTLYGNSLIIIGRPIGYN